MFTFDCGAMVKYLLCFAPPKTKQLAFETYLFYFCLNGMIVHDFGAYQKRRNGEEDVQPVVNKQKPASRRRLESIARTRAE